MRSFTRIIVLLFCYIYAISSCAQAVKLSFFDKNKQPRSVNAYCYKTNLKNLIKCPDDLALAIGYMRNTDKSLFPVAYVSIVSQKMNPEKKEPKDGLLSRCDVNSSSLDSNAQLDLYIQFSDFSGEPQFPYLLLYKCSLMSSVLRSS